LNKRLGTTSQQHQQLLAVKDKTVQQSISVKQQIDTERSKLSHLKQRQAQLNKLLQQLALAEKKQKQAAAKKAAAEAKARQTAAVVKTQTSNSPSSTAKQQESIAVSSNNDSVDDVKITNATPATPQTIPAIKPTVADNSVEDNSPFMARKLAKPISGEVAVGFGQMRDSVKNNGVLIHANDNTPVYSVSRGTVLFSGELPGFGQIIVIDNGDNYTSVYSGVLSKVAKGVTVTAGQLIASSGAEANQPMGGVYFELRHLGKPVNPNKLFD
jgi:septal ring factor EnvC (AmiA/AmiB activator)